MSSPKIFFVVLILLATLFVTGIGLTIHSDSGETPDRFRTELEGGKHPWISKIGKLFPPKTPPLETGSSGCISYQDRLLTIRESDRCIVIASPAMSRMLIIPPPEFQIAKFRVLAGTITFVSDKLNQVEPAPQWSPDGNERSLVVGKENENRLTLGCLGSAPCRLEFE
jgi:hypothetical protein